MMKINLLGVRGSVNASKTKAGEATDYFGADTSCYWFENGDSDLIIDAGAGIRYFPTDRTRDTLLLFSHVHDDHTSGLGFFGRMYYPQDSLVVMASDEHMNSLRLHYSMPGRMFPLNLKEFVGVKNRLDLKRQFEFGSFGIESFELSHPQRCYGYVVTDLTTGKKAALITDHEHDRNLGELGEGDMALIERIRGCEVALIDGQYVAGEYDPEQVGEKGLCKVGWGHCVDEKAVRMGLEAEVGRVVLIHHDPEHSDEFLFARGDALRNKFETGNVMMGAQEGVIELG